MFPDLLRRAGDGQVCAQLVAIDLQMTLKVCLHTVTAIKQTHLTLHCTNLFYVEDVLAYPTLQCSTLQHSKALLFSSINLNTANSVLRYIRVITDSFSHIFSQELRASHVVDASAVAHKRKRYVLQHGIQSLASAVAHKRKRYVLQHGIQSLGSAVAHKRKRYVLQHGIQSLASAVAHKRKRYVLQHGIQSLASAVAHKRKRYVLQHGIQSLGSKCFTLLPLA